jgi:pectinesterase
MPPFVCVIALILASIRVGSSHHADSKTIMGGVQLVPDGATKRWTIEIEAGVYNERVHVANTKGPLTMQGLAQAESVVLLSACPGGAGDGKLGCIPCPPLNKSKPAPGMRAELTTMLVLSDDFIATNMTIANNACGYDAKRAHQSDALQAMGDRQFFSNCRILGAQDTLLTGAGSTRQYFHRSFINGSCDSIYGGSSAVFDQCTITITDHITAQKPPETGGPIYLIVNSSLLKPRKGEFDYPASKGKTELGRPWGDHAHVVYKNVYKEDHIAPCGWGDWSHSSCSKFGSKCRKDPKCWCQNVTYAEYNSTGPGAAPSERVEWSQQLSAAEAADVTPTMVLRGWVPLNETTITAV